MMERIYPDWYPEATSIRQNIKMLAELSANSK